MRFNCGPDPELEQREIVKAMKEWHQTVAWLPVRVGEGVCAWLEVVERRYPEAFFGTYSRTARKGDVTKYRLPVGKTETRDG